jgi:hypothetical protein
MDDRNDSAGFADPLTDFVFFAITIAGCSALGYIVWLAL